MEMNRRTLAKGAAWATPVVVASAAVPAYAASSPLACQTGNFLAPAPSDENGSTTNWTVPAGVNSICFTVLGAAGGGYGNTPGGAGAQVTGTLPVKPGDTLTLIVGSGGISEKASWARAFGTAPATGGKGYGDGGDAADIQTTEPNITMAYAKPNEKALARLQRFGSSGGAGSAILLNGQPVVIAGGGGGGGFPASTTLQQESATGSNDEDRKPATWKGAQVSNTNGAFASETTSQQQAGSAGGNAADASGVTVRTTTDRSVIAGETFSLGSGAKAGVAGVGGVSGPNDGVYTGASLDEKVNGYVAGGNGESVSAPGPAKGGSGVALDKEHTVVMTDDGLADAIGTVRLISIGGGGGGGYGGGAAGSAKFYGGVWNGYLADQIDRTNGGDQAKQGKDANEHGVTVGVANPGAAGGSYFASSIADGAIAQGSNANSTGGTRNHGAISFSF